MKISNFSAPGLRKTWVRCPCSATAYFSPAFFSTLIFGFFHIRESSFNMTREVMKILRGGSENFRHPKGGGGGGGL